MPQNRINAVWRKGAVVFDGRGQAGCYIARYAGREIISADGDWWVYRVSRKPVTLRGFDEVEIYFLNGPREGTYVG